MKDDLVKQMFDYVPHAQFFSKDIGGNFTAANENLIHDLGLSEESELIGLTDYDIYPKVIADVFHSDDQHVINSGKPLTNRLELMPMGGEFYWFVTHRFPIIEKAKVTGVAGFTNVFNKSDHVFGVKNKF